MKRTTMKEKHYTLDPTFISIKSISMINIHYIVQEI
jgi:hypothetical protein